MTTTPEALLPTPRTNYPWYKWPLSKESPARFPLYLIVPRLILAPVVYMGIGITFAALFIGWGPYRATQFWRITQ